MPAWLRGHWMLLPVLVGLAGAAGRVQPCDPQTALCGFDRPEDLTAVPGTTRLLVSTSSAVEPLMLVDVETGLRERVYAGPVADADRDANAKAPRRSRQRVSRELGGAVDCKRPPAALHAAGHDLQLIDGALRIAVLNRESGTRASRIELLELDREGRGPAAWIGCVPVPSDLALNDVALGRGGELYASHMFDAAAARGELQRRFLAREPTGAAWRWSRASGWAMVPGTDVSFANGIALLRDSRTLVLAATYGQELVFVDLSTGTTRRLAVPLQPDNLTATDDGSVLATGHTGTPVSGVDPCRDPAAKPCGFPFAVARVAASGSVAVAFSHDGSRLPGASVAVLRGGRLYLGSAFGDRIAVVEIGRRAGQ